MDLGTAVGAIKLMYDGSGADQARQDMSSLEQSGQATNLQMAANGAALMGLGAGALKFVGDAVSGAADVEAVMKSVQASSGATADQIEQLTKLSSQLGADSIFETQDVAEAADVLSKAGISIEEQLGGSLKSVVDLAAATGESMTSAAGTVADAQAIFRLGGEDTARVADLTTAALNASKIGIDEYNAGFRNLAPTMANFASNQEEAIDLLGQTGEVVAFFTANGLKGADAGLSFTRMLQNLATPATQEYADAIKEAGINVFDASGEFVGADEVIRQVNKAFEGLTDQEKFDLMDKLGIGAEAQDVVGIISAVGDEYTDFTADMAAGNTAAEQAEILMSGLKGALEGLSGTVSAAMQGMGSGLLAPLEGIVRAITAVVEAFTMLPGPIQSAVGAFIGFFGVIATAVGAFMTFQAAGAALGAIFPGLGAGMLALLGPIALVAAALAALFLAYQTNFLGIKDMIDGALGDVQKTVDTFGKRFGASFGARQAQGVNGLSSAIGAFGDALRVATGINIVPQTEALADALQAAGETARWAYENGYNPLTTGLAALATLTDELGMTGLSDQLAELAAGSERFSSAFEAGFAQKKDAGWSGAAAAVDAFGEALKAATGIDITGFTDSILEPVNNLATAFGNAKDRVSDAISSFTDLIGSEFGTIRDVLGELFSGDLAGAAQVLGDALGTLGGNIGDSLSQLGTSLGSAAQGVGDFLANVGQNIGPTLENLGNTIGPALQNAFNAAGEFISGGGLASLVQTVSGALMEAFNAGGEWAGGIAATIGSALSAALQTIGNFLGGFNPGQLASDVGSKLSEAFSGAGEFLSNVGATIGSALSAALSNIGQFLGGFNPGQLASDVGAKIQEAFSNVGTFVQNVGATIGSALSAALQQIGNFLGGFNPGQLASDIGSKIQEAFSNAGTFMTGIAESIGSALVEALNGISGFLSGFNPGELVSQVVDMITSAFGGGGGSGRAGTGPVQGGGGGGMSSVAQAIGTALSSALNQIGQYLSGFNAEGAVAGIKEKIETAINAIADFDFQALGDNIKAGLEAACGTDLSGVFDTLGQAISGVTTGLSSLAQAIGGYVEDITAKLEELKVPEALETLVTTITDLGTALANDIGTKLTEIGSALSGMKIESAITDTLTNLASAFTSMKDALADGLGSKLTDLGNALGSISIPTDVISGLQSLASALGGIKDAIAGAAGGINADGLGNVVSTISDAIGGAFGSDQASAAASQTGDFATNFINGVAASFAQADWTPISNAIQSGLAGIMEGGGASSGRAGTGPVQGGGGASGIGATFVQGFITDIVAGFTPEAFAPVKTAFDAALAAAMSAAGTAGGGGEGGAGGGTSAGVQVIQDLFTDMGAAIGQNTGTLVAAMQAAMTVLQGAVDQGVTGIQTSMQAIVTVITQLAPVAAQAVVSMGTAIGAGFTAMQATINASISAIQASIQALVPAIEGIATAVGTAINGMATTIQSAFADMQATVNSAVSGIQASVQAIVTALQQTATAAGEAAASIGTAIVGALEAAVPAVEAAAAALGAAATVPIVGAILPGSPSRVIMPVAESVPEAITTAYEQGMPAVEGAAEDLGAAATEGVTDAVTSTADGIATELEGQEPVVEDAMTSMVTSATDAAASHLAEAADLFSQFGLTFGNEISQGMGEGMDSGMTDLASRLRSNAEELRSSIMERVKKMHEGFLPDANTVIGQRNPWAAKLMSDQNITVNVEAMLDGDKMADWTTEVTLGGMLGVKDSGGRKRGLSPTA